MTKLTFKIVRQDPPSGWSSEVTGSLDWTDEYATALDLIDHYTGNPVDVVTETERYRDVVMVGYDDGDLMLERQNTERANVVRGWVGTRSDQSFGLGLHTVRSLTIYGNGKV